MIGEQNETVALIEEICGFIDSDIGTHLTLTKLGARFGLSGEHLQRQFKAVTSITPYQYIETRRLALIRQALSHGADIQEATYEAGYQSLSRLYSKSKQNMGMTPSRYRDGGEGAEILFTIASGPLGFLLVAATPQGICSVSLGDEESYLEEVLESEFKNAVIVRDDQAMAGWVEDILAHLEGRYPNLNLPLDIQATAFQRQVWQALQQIPYGSTRSYKQVAEALGKPTASRAVARACATNPVALLIPCHRVVGSNGSLSGYRWGLERKATLLDNEQSAI